MIHAAHTMTCHECGEDVENGLMNWVRHWKVCLRNAPNESIESHWREVAREKIVADEEAKWNPVLKILREEEMIEWWHLTACGAMEYRGGVEITMVYSVPAMKRILEFKKRMYEKYIG